MTGGKDMLVDFVDSLKSSSDISFGGNSKGKVLRLGKFVISSDSSLKNVMLVESLHYNLLSTIQLARASYGSLFSEFHVTVFKRDTLKVVFVRHVEGNLYVVDFSKESTHLKTWLMAKADVGWLWHRRLAHVSMRNLQSLIKGDHIVGLSDVSFAKDRVCSACIAGKQHEKQHKMKTIITSTRPLELLHLDIFGPPSYDSLGGRRYCLVIVNEYTRYTWVFFLKTKDETQETFISFAKEAQRQHQCEIMAIQSDNGTEFKNYTMDEFLSDEGIKHQYSAAYTPQQNGVAERKNRILIEMARTMLDEYKSPYKLWAEAINTACHVSNRLYLHKLKNKTLYELLTGKKPNVKYFRVFGCKCFILNKKTRLAKFEAKTYEGIFVGYASNSHSYRVLNKSTGCIEESSNVEFDEDNGSQAKKIVPSIVGDEAPSQVIRTMGIGHILPQETPHVQVIEEGASAPLEETPQGKSSSPPQGQDVSGEQAPIQEQGEVHQAPKKDQGQSQPNGDDPIIEAQDLAQESGQDQVQEIVSPQAKQK